MSAFIEREASFLYMILLSVPNRVFLEKVSREATAGKGAGAWNKIQATGRLELDTVC